MSEAVGGGDGFDLGDMYLAAMLGDLFQEQFNWENEMSQRAQAA